MTDISSAPSFDYPAELRLDGQGFVVIGVGGGVGGQACRAFSQAGAKLLCVDINPEAAEARAKEVGGEAFVADGMKRADLEKVFAHAQQLFGKSFSGVLDGIGRPMLGALPSYDDEAITQQFELVLGHAIRVLQIAGPILAENGGGSIAFVGSIAGKFAGPGVPLYGMAKAGLHHLVAAAAQEFGPSGVRVNAISLGRILGSGAVRPSPEALRTIEAAIPLRRTGVPQDAAGALLFLASNLASYITGAVIPVDGGVGIVSPLPTSQR